MSLEFIKGAMLQLLAIGVLLSGVSFIAFAVLLPVKNLFQIGIAAAGIFTLIAIFWYLMALADPKSTSNPFTNS